MARAFPRSYERLWEMVHGLPGIILGSVAFPANSIELAAFFVKAVVYNSFDDILLRRLSGR